MNNTNIQYHKILDFLYDITFDNGIKLGELLKEIDGYFVFHAPRENNSVCLSSDVLRDIANKLDELNKD